MASSPFLGPSYQLASRPASVQRTVNLIPVPLEPGNERTDWVFKDVHGLTEVTTTIYVPPVLPEILFGAHFDSELVDYFNDDYADDYADLYAGRDGIIAGQTGVNYETTNPKFGAGAFKNTPTLADPVYSERKGTKTLGGTAGTDWMIDGWININTPSLPLAILTMQGNNATGGSFGPGGDTRQFMLEVEAVSGNRYLTATMVNRSGTGLQLISTVATPLNTWTYFAICEDSAGVRMYINTAKVDEELVERTYIATPFTNQVFLVGAKYAGGTWPTGNVYTAHMDGFIDDIRVQRGTNSVLWTTSTIVPPSIPFTNP